MRAESRDPPVSPLHPLKRVTQSLARAMRIAIRVSVKERAVVKEEAPACRRKECAHVIFKSIVDAMAKPFVPPVPAQALVLLLAEPASISFDERLIDFSMGV